MPSINQKIGDKMTSSEIKKILKQNLARYGNIFIPEFTHGNLRIDAIIIDTGHKWIRGFEIKTKKPDFQKDTKWTEYSQFCSSLCIVCPEGLIESKEVESPFGLIWIVKTPYDYYKIRYIKRPKNFQKRNSLSWFWTYVNVLTLEIRRIYFELENYKLIEIK